MSPLAEQPVTVALADTQTVSGLWVIPAEPRAVYVMAHGAGAGMRHVFLAAVADGLARRGIATLRYQFPYLERGAKRPDAPPVAHATVRAAAEVARARFPHLPLYAGGKSFGGRMTSQAQALAPLPGVRGLIFFGFPLHPAGRPSAARAKHLADVQLPMLFLQGTRDKLAELAVLEPVCRDLHARATLQLVPDADHAFHVPARSGRTDAEVREELLDTVVTWVGTLA